MGQVTSSNSGYESPVYVASGLSITKIVIQPSQREPRKVIRIDPDTGNLILPKTKPLSKFTQNASPQEHPFLLNCSSSDTITVSFKLHAELLAQFQDINTDSFTVYSSLILRAYDEGYNTVKQTSLASKLVVNSSTERLTMDPSVIELTQEKDVFKIAVKLDDLVSYGKTYLAFVGGNEEIFKTVLFVEKDENATDLSLANATYKDALYSFPSDGQEFRQTLSQLEEKSISLRSLLKASIKKAQALDEATRHLALARSGFSSSLSDLTNYARAVENPLMCDIINDLIPVLTEKSTADIEESNILTRNVLTPLILIYNSDIKLLSNKRKMFYDHAKEFYSSLGSKRNSSDTDMLKSQVAFELNRYDYFQYLNEFRNGHSVRNLLYNFSLYLENHNKKTFSPVVNENASMAQFYYQNFFKYKGAQQRMRNELAAAKTLKELPVLNTSVSVHDAAAPLPVKSPDSSFDQTLLGKDSNSSVIKSGILWTLGGQNKSGWNKQLVCITDNVLSEYIDWRENKEVLRCNPVDLTFSCIKTVDTLRDRKYCMEIITPSNVKRLFQAESEIERQSWIHSFTTAASLKANDNQYNRPKSMAIKANGSRGKRVSLMLDPSNSEFETTSNDPLALVREVDLSNQLCCDCGSTKQVDWISLNLLVIVCIDCSGVHRSLGSHISKIRSLSLDTKSFSSKEAQMLLYHVSNKFVNAYLQGALSPQEKLTPLASDQQRKEFIVNKYLKKKYLAPEHDFKANDSLIKGVHSANVPLVLKSLAYGGNVRMVVIKDVRGEKKEITLFEYSLTHCHGDPDFPVFDVSQLLYLNNAPCGDKVSPVLDLNEAQKNFWASKIVTTLPITPVTESSPLKLSTPTPTETQTPPLKKGLSRSQSMLLRRNSSFKSSDSDKHKSTDVPKKDRSNRVSRFRMLQPFRSDN